MRRCTGSAPADQSPGLATVRVPAQANLSAWAPSRAARLLPCALARPLDCLLAGASACDVQCPAMDSGLWREGRPAGRAAVGPCGKGTYRASVDLAGPWRMDEPRRTCTHWGREAPMLPALWPLRIVVVPALCCRLQHGRHFHLRSGFWPLAIVGEFAPEARCGYCSLGQRLDACCETYLCLSAHARAHLHTDWRTQRRFGAERSWAQLIKTQAG